MLQRGDMFIATNNSNYDGMLGQIISTEHENDKAYLGKLYDDTLTYFSKDEVKPAQFKITDLDDNYFRNMIERVNYIFKEQAKQLATVWNPQLDIKQNLDSKLTFPLVQDLTYIYKYVIGENFDFNPKQELDISSNNIDDWSEAKQELIFNKCTKIKKIVWNNPFTTKSMEEYDPEINWQRWDTTRLGFLIHLADLRLHLQLDNKSSATGLATLSGLTVGAITKKCKSNTIKAEKFKNLSWLIPPAEAKQFLKNRDLPYYENI